MRITCPLCGDRDHREFSYKSEALARPAPDAGETAWHDYLHLRDNPAGDLREYWSHDAGCGAWLIVTRDTATHVIRDVTLARRAAS